MTAQDKESAISANKCSASASKAMFPLLSLKTVAPGDGPDRNWQRLFSLTQQVGAARPAASAALLGHEQLLPSSSSPLTLPPAHKRQRPRGVGGFRVGILGGGVAGSTVALRLADLGIDSTLIEAGNGLVNGPPICHLHAGGNLYREISDDQCLKLLKQSVDSVRAFPHAINRRPTVIAVPTTDPGSAEALLPRLRKVAGAYADLCRQDPANQVLGKPEHYYKLYSRAAYERLRTMPLPAVPRTQDDWVIPVARAVKPDTLKFPVVLVEEYGWSLMRMAATATLGLVGSDRCDVRLHTKAVGVQKASLRGSSQPQQQSSSSDSANSGNNNGWHIRTNHPTRGEETVYVDYLVNACGFRTGTVDDMTGFSRQRLVEYKAAYVTRWEQMQGHWPEVIFHGQRGTPDGMAQMTPYAGNVFQLHGMTKKITLFDGGLVNTDTDTDADASAGGKGKQTQKQSSAQPALPQRHLTRIDQGWQPAEIHERTQRAISHVARYVPSFAAAQTAGKPLHGAQQIAGKDKTMRAFTVSFEEQRRYARVEIVKASSALEAADRIAAQLAKECGVWVPKERLALPEMAVTTAQREQDVEAFAVELARSRGFAPELALVSPVFDKEVVRRKLGENSKPAAAAASSSASPPTIAGRGDKTRRRPIASAALAGLGFIRDSAGEMRGKMGMGQQPVPPQRRPPLLAML